MRNLEERGIGYPLSPSEKAEGREESRRVTLQHPERITPIRSPPNPAIDHIEDDRRNYSPTISFDQNVKRLFQDSSIKDAMGTGWILPLHQLLSVSLEEGRLDETRIHIDEMVQGFGDWKDSMTGNLHTIVTIRTFWVPDVDDGTSLLVTHPHFSRTGEYTVLPTLIDADKIPTHIDIQLMIHRNGEFSLYNNTPVAQVIPIRRSLLRADSRIVEPVEE